MAKAKPKRTRAMVQKESLKMSNAFIYYFELGSDRTLKKVADEFKISPSTAKRWSSLFMWQDRLIQLERTVADLVEKKSIARVTKSRDGSLKILAALKGDLVKKLIALQIEGKGGEMPIKITTMSDLSNLIRTEELLLGHPTDRVEGGITFISSVPSPDAD